MTEYDDMMNKMDSPEMMKYEFGWTDYRGIYDSYRWTHTYPDRVPDISTSVWSQIIGTLIIMLPVAIVTYWVMTWVQ